MKEQDDDIEESIIEEDIKASEGIDSPGSPLITSKTKQKGKDLKLMRPPKPL